MNMKIKDFKAICLIWAIIGGQNFLFGQWITGPSSNLCPGVLYTYTSLAGCDEYGWTCSGCVPGTLNSNYNIINVGTNPDGTVYAKVAWNNITSNFCTVTNKCEI